jgi:hypothetical protein
MSSLFSKTVTSNTSAGLRAKPTYQELINYIQDDKETIRYPNRDASIMANSFEFSQLVGEGFRQMQQYSMQAYDDARGDALLRRHAAETGMHYGKLKALTKTLGVRPVEVPMGGDEHVLKDLPDFMARMKMMSPLTSDTSSVTDAPPTTTTGPFIPADGGPDMPADGGPTTTAAP